MKRGLRRALYGQGFTAVWLMVRKRVESWLYWIAVNVAGLGLYYAKEVGFVSLLYVVLLFIAARGFVSWLRVAGTPQVVARWRVEVARDKRPPWSTVHRSPKTGARSTSVPATVAYRLVEVGCVPEKVTVGSDLLFQLLQPLAESLRFALERPEVRQNLHPVKEFLMPSVQG